MVGLPTRRGCVLPYLLSLGWFPMGRQLDWRSPSVLRTAAIIVTFLVSSVGMSVAAASPTAREVQSAKDKVSQLEKEVQQSRADLAQKKLEAARVAQQLYQAQSNLEKAQSALADTQQQLDDVQANYSAITDQLDARTRAAYIQGPASNLGLLLGSSSMAELSARLEYMNAIARNDADLADEALALRTVLSATEEKQAAVKVAAYAAAAKEQAASRQIRAAFDAQQSLVESIARKEAAAKTMAAKLSKQYQASLTFAASPSSGGGPPPPGFAGVFKVCPVGSPRALTDSFGAPRYGGGFHIHLGDDIMSSPGVPIYAPFDGTAYNSTNTLGGLAVTVRGSAGYVYNAHMSRIGKLGSVRAGDVIGYIGDTGDAPGVFHDHFEFHPTVMPASWPASPYGYSTYAGAINPYPLLVAACG